ncbi:MAG: hypothetical protein UY89_C0036G0006 [Parcubacteria group bacterium GW2011_GWA1_54_9]|nr:MAG: hypothetical protein UY89_C0036G0006 [Parcubacteria group bacterium GW2011_GWA1_54_9]
MEHDSVYAMTKSKSYFPFRCTEKNQNILYRGIRLQVLTCISCLRTSTFKYQLVIPKHLHTLSFLLRVGQVIKKVAL